MAKLDQSTAHVAKRSAPRRGMLADCESFAEVAQREYRRSRTMTEDFGPYVTAQGHLKTLKRLAKRGILVDRAGVDTDALTGESHPYVSLICAAPDAEAIAAAAARAGLASHMHNAAGLVSQNVTDGTKGHSRALSDAAYRGSDRLIRFASETNLDLSFQIIGQTRHLFLTDLERGDDYLWTFLDGLMKGFESTPMDSRVDPEVAARRLDAPRAAVRTAIDGWLLHTIAELFSVVQLYAPEMKPAPVVLLHGSGTREDPDAAEFDDSEYASLAWVRSHVGEARPLAPAARRHAWLAWVELRRLLQVAHGQPAPLNLVVSLRDPWVWAWWPEYCEVHGHAGPAMSYAPLADKTISLPEAEEAPIQPGRMSRWLADWGLQVPSRLVPCPEVAGSQCPDARE